MRQKQFKGTRLSNFLIIESHVTWIEIKNKTLLGTENPYRINIRAPGATM